MPFVTYRPTLPNLLYLISHPRGGSIEKHLPADFSDALPPTPETKWKLEVGKCGGVMPARPAEAKLVPAPGGHDQGAGV